jgi:hypothetical protein
MRGYSAAVEEFLPLHHRQPDAGWLGLWPINWHLLEAADGPRNPGAQIRKLRILHEVAEWMVLLGAPSEFHSGLLALLVVARYVRIAPNLGAMALGFHPTQASPNRQSWWAETGLVRVSLSAKFVLHQP